MDPLYFRGFIFCIINLYSVIKTVFKSFHRVHKMAEGQDSSAKKITITVKTTKEKQTIEIEEDALIKDVSFAV